MRDTTQSFHLWMVRFASGWWSIEQASDPWEAAHEALIDAFNEGVTSSIAAVTPYL